MRLDLKVILPPHVSDDRGNVPTGLIQAGSWKCE